MKCRIYCLVLFVALLTACGGGAGSGNGPSTNISDLNALNASQQNTLRDMGLYDAEDILRTDDPSYESSIVKALPLGKKDGSELEKVFAKVFTKQSLDDTGTIIYSGIDDVGTVKLNYVITGNADTNTYSSHMDLRVTAYGYRTYGACSQRVEWDGVYSCAIDVKVTSDGNYSMDGKCKNESTISFTGSDAIGHSLAIDLGLAMTGNGNGYEYDDIQVTVSGSASIDNISVSMQDLETAPLCRNPQIVFVSPSTGEIGVPVTSDIKVALSEPMDATMVEGTMKVRRLNVSLDGTCDEYFPLTDDQGEIAGEFVWKEDGGEVTFVPSAPLDHATCYGVSFEGALVDERGYPVLEDTFSQFSTEEYPLQYGAPIKISANDQIHGISWDSGGNLWMASATKNYCSLDKINASTGEVIGGAIKLDDYCSSPKLAWDGEKFWYHDYWFSKIKSITAAGDAVSSISVDAGSVGGLVWDGTSIMVSEMWNDEVREYAPGGGLIAEYSLSLDGYDMYNSPSIESVEWCNGKYWVLDNEGGLHTWNKSTGETYYMSRLNYDGTFVDTACSADGLSLWIAYYNYSYDTGPSTVGSYVQKIDLPF